MAATDPPNSLQILESTGKNYLSFQPKDLSVEARGLCLILASCACRRLPAILFIRPWEPRRQWDLQGEIEEQDRVTAVPEWAKLIFEKTVHCHGDFFFPRAGFIGLPPGPRLSPPANGFHLSESVQGLIQQGILKIYTENDWLYVELTEAGKDLVAGSMSSKDPTPLLVELIWLIINSYPAPYIEPLWQITQQRCREVIDTTVIPFLSVIDWQQLKSSFLNLHSLMLFLIYFSFDEGFSLSGRPHFDLDVIHNLNKPNCDDLVVLQAVAFLRFKDQICRSLIEYNAPPDHVLSFLTTEYSRVHDILFRNLMCEVVRSMLGEALPSVSAEKTTTLVDWLENSRTSTNASISTLGIILQALSDSHTTIPQSVSDLSVQIALGFALGQRRSHARAIQILQQNLPQVLSEWSSDSYEYGTACAELMKSYNCLGQYSQAEPLGSMVIQQRSVHSMCQRTDTIYIQIALADSMIGQRNYQDARTLLNGIMGFTGLSKELILIVALRLNKIDRRTWSQTGSLSTEQKLNVLKKVTDPLRATNPKLVLDYLEELSLTVAQYQQMDLEWSEILSLITTSLRSDSANRLIGRDWRVVFLQGFHENINTNFPSLGFPEKVSTDTAGLPHRLGSALQETSIDASLGVANHTAHKAHSMQVLRNYVKSLGLDPMYSNDVAKLFDQRDSSGHDTHLTIDEIGRALPRRPHSTSQEDVSLAYWVSQAGDRPHITSQEDASLAYRLSQAGDKPHSTSQEDASLAYRFSLADDGLKSTDSHLKTLNPAEQPSATIFTAKSTEWSLHKLKDAPPWTDRGNGYVVEYEEDEEVPLKHTNFIASAGEGGCVEGCYCPMLGKEVAVKKVVTYGNKEIIDRLTKEMDYLRAIKHYHCIRMLGSYAQGDWFNIVMDPVATCDLRTYLKHEGSSLKIRKMEQLSGPRSELLPTLMGCLAHGLHYLHQKSKLRHRDIKPANILLDGRTVLFADFNLSKVVTEAQSGTSGPSRKTPMYTSPERAANKHRNIYCDIFSLGCVFAEIFSVYKGRTFDEFLTHRCNADPLGDGYYHRTVPAVIEWLDDLSTERCDVQIIRLLRSMLHIQPHQRPNAEQVWKVLSTCCSITKRHFCGPCCMPLLYNDPLLVESADIHPSKIGYASSHIARAVVPVPKDQSFQTEYARDQELGLEWVRYVRLWNRSILDIVKGEGSPYLLTRKRIIAGKRDKAHDYAHREAEILRKVQHRHVVRLYGTYRQGDIFALLYEPVANFDLRSYLELAELENKRARDLVVDIPFLNSSFGCLASALASVHAAGYNHGDIRPGNILVVDNEIPRIFLSQFSFGLKTDMAGGGSNEQRYRLPDSLSALRLGRQAEQDAGQSKGYPRTSTLVGQYKAPEWNCDERVSVGQPKADIFALGCVFLEIHTVLNGRRIRDFEAFRADESGRHAYHDTLPKTLEWLSSLDGGDRYETKERFHGILRRMIDKDPRQRPEARDVCSVLRQCKSCDGNPRCGSTCVVDGDK